MPVLRRYRCLNCGRDFAAEKRACAHCEIDAATDPLAATVIHPIVTIHYDPPHPKIKGRGLGHRACDPSKHIGSGRGSGVLSVVNCEACKANAAFQKAVEEQGGINPSILEKDNEVVSPTDFGGVRFSADGDCGCGKG